MPVLDAHGERLPAADEIRAALGRMAASEAFRGSPQLISFLRYVIEATLRGEQDRIKGYTIAIEALGRGSDFDPQSDPIVRVEATRLRRAIHRYYDNGGKHDPVQIELPLGSYVPSFRLAERRVVPLPAALKSPSPRFAAWRIAGWRNLAAGGLLIAFGASLYGGLDLAFDFNTPNPPSASQLVLASSRAAPAVAHGPTYPAVFVGAFKSDSDGAARTDALRAKLRDALARFDGVQVAADAPPSREHYQLTGSAEYDETGMATLTVRLVDTAEGSVTYSRTFSRDNRDGNDEDSVRDQDAIVREISAALAQSYGIIYAHERAKRQGPGETQYRCLIEAHDYWRSFDPQQYREARECLERATEQTPGFALGFAALAPLLAEEHRAGLATRSGDAPPLQRALAAARRAVELRPGSARAQQELARVQFARGEHSLALEAIERAVMLNPYDPSVLADYGALLMSLGNQERGVRLTRQAARASPVRPVRHDFFLFLTEYFAGDSAGAQRLAAMMTLEHCPLGLMANALTAAQRGETNTARSLFDRLAVMRPRLRDHMREELKKTFPAESIANRLAQDLGRIAAAPGG